MIDSYTYDITVQAEDTRTVFINGCAPSRKKPAHFSSQTAVPLLLFTGDYDFVQAGRDYLLNVEVDSGTAHAIFRELDKLKDFYVKKLGLPYEGGIYIISHKVVEPYKPGRSWGLRFFRVLLMPASSLKSLLPRQAHWIIKPSHFLDMNWPTTTLMVSRAFGSC